MTEITGSTPGTVVLVGAGPAGGNLLTAEGAKWLGRADVVVYDRLVCREVLDLCRQDAERIYVGKSPGALAADQEQINRILVAKSREGKLVVRLKGGDPLVFGRGGEEAEALAEAGVSYRIVPGVTAAVAAGAQAGIPLTHRKMASTVALVTGHEEAGKDASAIDFEALARIDTVVFYMGVANLHAIAEHLIKAGRSPSTPAAVVERAGSARQRTVVATLETIARQAQSAAISPPAVIVVGEVARLHDRLAWFEELPLFGCTALVTRTRRQSPEPAEKLAELGAYVIEAPAIEVHPLEDFNLLDAALRNLRQFDWLALTSANGVGFLFERLGALGLDARALAGVKVAAVGSPTAKALRACGIAADLVPGEFTTEELAKALCRLPADDRRRVLLARADIATAELAARLTAAGSQVTEVTLYRTTCPAELPQEAVECLRDGKVDWITFTSASAVRNFLALVEAAGLDTELPGIKLASIGPATTAALHRRGLAVTATALPHTVQGLAEAIAAAER